MVVDREQFYKAYRKHFGRIKKQEVVDNLEVFLTSLTLHSKYLDKGAEVEQMAYIMATVHHEAWNWKKGIRYGAMKEGRAGRLQPRLRKLQNRYWLTGYYGRGPVQLTWKRNYQWAATATGLNLVRDPDILLRDLDAGYKVTILGMALGAYTGRRLGHYITKVKKDYYRARKIVNGMDKAKKIAGYAKKFELVLRSSATHEI